METVKFLNGEVRRVTSRHAGQLINAKLAILFKEEDNFDKMPPEWKERNIPEVKEEKQAIETKEEKTTPATKGRPKK